MLGVNEHVLLDNFQMQAMKEETITVTRDDTLVPYIGNPIF